MQQFCNHDSPCNFINTIPDVVEYQDNLWKNYRLKINPTLRSGYGFPHRYSKTSILEEAMTKFDSCQQWQDKIEQSKEQRLRMGQKIREGKESATAKRIQAFEDTVTQKDHMFTKEEFRDLERILNRYDYHRYTVNEITWCTTCDKSVVASHSNQSRGLCSVEKRILVNKKLDTGECANKHVCMLCNQDITHVANHMNKYHVGMQLDHYENHHVLSNATVGSEFAKIVRDRPCHECTKCTFWKTAWAKYQVINTCGQSGDIICNRIEKLLQDPNDVAMLLGTSARNRFEIRNALNKRKRFYVESRGENDNRVMLVWRREGVSRILHEHLPLDIVDKITGYVNGIYDVEDKAHQQNQKNNRMNKINNLRKRRTCDICDMSGDKCELLVSVYIPGTICSDCIDADDELSSHKWESLWY
jgi:hypothetical protein